MMLMVSSRGILVKSDSTSKLAIVHLLKLVSEISLANSKEFFTVNWFFVNGSRSGTKNLAKL